MYYYTAVIGHIEEIARTNKALANNCEAFKRGYEKVQNVLEYLTVRKDEFEGDLTKNPELLKGNTYLAKQIQNGEVGIRGLASQCQARFTECLETIISKKIFSKKGLDIREIIEKNIAIKEYKNNFLDTLYSFIESCDSDKILKAKHKIKKIDISEGARAHAKIFLDNCKKYIETERKPLAKVEYTTLARIDHILNNNKCRDFTKEIESALADYLNSDFVPII
ncbi:Uncharacterised protein [Candidatus Tiddalikarchaeum anstoanum]|nr:Uncharacterised protein [Candidatus Tiddalikarchaeum anstoanum]